MFHEVKIAGLGFDPGLQSPVLLIKKKDGENILPIVIGFFEATAIVMALNDNKAVRPMTHDLFSEFIDKTGLKVGRVFIDDVRKNVYYSRVFYDGREDDKLSFSMDARPSDAVALALRFNAPIFVDEEVFLKYREETSVNLKYEDYAEEISEESSLSRRWAKYLENIPAEEFGKYKV